MRIIRSIRTAPASASGCVLTIGNFDGLHRGHQAVIERARERAAELGLPAALMTFDPTPRAFFLPHDPPPRLSSLREKMEDAACFGIDVFVRARFDRAFAKLSPEAFLDDLIERRLGARAILVGRDFRFGHRRAGGIHTLERFADRRGVELLPVPDVYVDGDRVSSTRVRECLNEGDVPGAARLLGRAYRVTGRVIGGERLGRTLGFPTANLRLERPAALRYGVYAVRVRLADGSEHAGAASFGVRPTVNGRDELLETYLLDFSGDLYGRRIDVFFDHFVRAEAHYDSLEALTRQMHTDVAEVRRLLANTSSR
ncbi:bifunctional riboflavin kinase/FAD synthetase [Salinisphaera sp.]|uniref:bifunctional riboflavin kinase/FAD synthetase n=1 Tax=Salinisphaera sp. TaxID=1914330 RepID=UPI002D77FC6D|nr:bifunctional riboflavin kinase/FAD synthetase [Salinisphaera sp.]HET7314734.1 bifunctional riboflavin kinase/FAD synthetase [Salinisphaera sp.]